MSTDRRTVAAVLERIADLLELRGDNAFKVRAFANGARTVKGLTDFDERLAAGTLLEVKGIGKGLVAEIDALAAGGPSPLLEELERDVPEGLRAIATVPGIGPKKARTLHDDLEIRSLAELEYACRENRLKTLKGFGEKTQARVLEAIRGMRRRAGLLRRDDILHLERLAARAVRDIDGEAIATGAYRRGALLADGVDLVIVARDREAATTRVLDALPLADDPEADARGVVRAHLQSGAEVRLVAVPPEGRGPALLATTGPAAHVRALGRLRAAEVDALGEPEKRWPSEVTFYGALGLPWIAPELRDDPAIVEAAAKGALPDLLEAGELRGALHAHTTWSDGSGTVAEMLEAAVQAGLGWVGLSDHSRAATYAGGLTQEQVVEQQVEIDREAARRDDLVVLKGTECDILGDGSLDYDAATLDRFDFVIASVHSQFTMPEEEMTARVLRALADPHVTVLGHPTGRLLLGRDGFAIDVPAVLRACAEHGVAIELNSHPARLDLDLEWMPLVLELGLMVSIGPDAHEPDGFDVLQHGLAVARRARLPKDRVLNTLDADGVRAFARARRGGAR